MRSAMPVIMSKYFILATNWQHWILLLEDNNESDPGNVG
jgi:hypothetical protein